MIPTRPLSAFISPKTAFRVAQLAIIVFVIYSYWPEGRPVRTNAPFDRYQVFAHCGTDISGWSITLEKDGQYSIVEHGPMLLDQFKGTGQLDDDSTVALFQLIEKVDYFSLPDHLGVGMFGGVFGRLTVKNSRRSNDVFLAMSSAPSNPTERTQYNHAVRIIDELERLVDRQKLQRVPRKPVE